MSRKKGIFPDPTKGWEFVAYTKDWVVFFNKTNPEWTNIKAVKKGFDERKANYYLAWNGSRFADNYDLPTIKKHQKELFEFVTSALVLL